MGKGEGVREVQTSGAAAAAGGRHAEAEAAATGVGDALADVARAARATGHALAEFRHVEDVHLIFFGVGQEAAPQVLTRAEHALIVGGADAVAAALHRHARRIERRFMSGDLRSG